MDAVKFMKEYNRMCKSYFDNEECEGCPLKNKYCFGTFLLPTNKNSYNEVTATVENWSKENPEEVGKKYIIEIDEVDRDRGRKQYHIKGAQGFWISDGNLTDLEEYKEHDACKGCKYEDKTEKEEPCVCCRYAYRDKWETTR